MQYPVDVHCVLDANGMCVLPGAGHAKVSHITIVVQHSLSKHAIEWHAVVAASTTNTLLTCSHPVYALHIGADIPRKGSAILEPDCLK